MNSKIAKKIEKSKDPVQLDEKNFEEITVNGVKGIWLNKSEIDWESNTLRLYLNMLSY